MLREICGQAESQGNFAENGAIRDGNRGEGRGPVYGVEAQKAMRLMVAVP
jgi:hypothetical protein